MPNRTIYLPDDLDAASREHRLNLSRLAQEAIRAAIADRRRHDVDAIVDLASGRVRQLGIPWDHGGRHRTTVDTGRTESGER